MYAKAVEGTVDWEASVNFVSAHDGFTLRNLLSYNEKHNDANAEDTRNGESHNRSWNHTLEGDTDDSGIKTREEPASSAIFSRR